MLAVGVVTAPMAQAAPARPACNLVSDPSGDVLASAPGVDNSDFDIRSGDIATNGRSLTAAIRLTGLTAEDPKSVASRVYEFDFAANGHGFGLVASLVTGGANFDAVVYSDVAQGGRMGTTLGPIAGVIDTAHHQIRLTAPLGLFASYANFRQTYIDHLAIGAARATGQNGTAPPGGKVTVGAQSTAVVVDDASSTAKYTPGQRSCLTVGR